METPRIADVLAVMEEFYPPASAHSWDSVGLIAGDPEAPARRIHFAVDPTIEVIIEAARARADLLITHHPLLLRGVHSVATTSAKGEAIHRAIRAGLALYNAHTNADDARPGVSDALARTVGLDNLRPLDPAPSSSTRYLLALTCPREAVDAILDAATAAGAGTVGEYTRCAFTVEGIGTFEPGPDATPAIGRPGQREHTPEMRVELEVPAARRQAVVEAMRAAHPYEEPAIWVTELVTAGPGTTGTGRVGTLEEPLTLELFAMHVAEALPFTPQGVRVAGELGELVRTVAVCGGSGDSLFDQVRAAGVDVYVTADLRHHPASEQREEARGGKPYLIDVAHWASEWPWLHGAASRVQTELHQRGFSVDMRVSETRTDPWTMRLPSSGGIVR